MAMHRAFKSLATIGAASVVLMSGCSSDAETAEDQDSGALTASRGEHDRDGGPGHDEGGEAGHGEEGEEDATEYALDDVYDKVRNGARLILAYDAEDSSFSGTVENTTDKTLERVRVEVHLSNGTELGPTVPAELAPGEVRDVVLKATEKDFDAWTAHPEAGAGEH